MWCAPATAPSWTSCSMWRRTKSCWRATNTELCGRVAPGCAFGRAFVRVARCDRAQGGRPGACCGRLRGRAGPPGLGAPTRVMAWVRPVSRVRHSRGVRGSTALSPHIAWWAIRAEVSRRADAMTREFAQSSGVAPEKNCPSLVPESSGNFFCADISGLRDAGANCSARRVDEGVGGKIFSPSRRQSMSLGGRAFISTAAGWPPGWRIGWYCRASESGTHDCRRSARKRWPATACTQPGISGGLSFGRMDVHIRIHGIAGTRCGATFGSRDEVWQPGWFHG